MLKNRKKKTFKTAKGAEGSVFNFNIIDQEGSEMQVCCFNKVVDKFYSIVKEGEMYEIIGGYIKINDHKYNQTKSDYQIALNEDSRVIPVEDDKTISDDILTLTKLDELYKLKVHSTIDFIALVIEIKERKSVRSKYGEMEIKKLVVADDSGFKVDFTLWKHHANTPVNVGDIILVKKAKIGEYSGRNISASDDSVVQVNPYKRSLEEKISILKGLMKKTDTKLNTETPQDSSEAHKSNGMEVDEDGNNQVSKENVNTINTTNANTSTFENFKTYQDIKAAEYVKKREEIKITSLSEAYNLEEKTHRVKVYVTQFNNSEKNFYAGCPKCKKKLVEADQGMKCATCNEEVKKPQYFFTISVRVKDYASDQWVDNFGPVAEKMLKITAEEYRNALLENNDVVLSKVCENVEFQSFIMTVKSRTNVYNNIVKKKLNCFGVERIDLKSEAERMLKDIENMI